jgi:ABC-type histidine transport system ATPase subunit
MRTQRVNNTHLRCIHLVEHDYRGAVVVEDQPPEVGGRVGQRVLGYDEGCWLFMAL